VLTRQDWALFLNIHTLLPRMSGAARITGH
jgi:hypothetical protein